jgi:hypothetical protein
MKYLKKCRNCNSNELISVLSIGEQYLTGVFPKNINQKITKGPLDLFFCNNCSLLQLGKSYDLTEMYGDNYGYRSGLNQSMIEHLTKKIIHLQSLANPKDSDLVIDIGSNDATSLNAYKGGFIKLGIDPTGNKFFEFYQNEIKLIPDFFTYEIFNKNFPDKKAKIITSIAMFYDLEDPNQFVKDINKCLDEDGIWHFEQSYMPSMLRTNAYDTICHEHLEFYSLRVVKDILEKNDLKIIDVQMNAINGGSFAVTAVKDKCTRYEINKPIIEWLLNQESRMKLDSIEPYKNFRFRVEQHKNDLKLLIKKLNDAGKKVFGYGASTKGNVLLQYCGFTIKDIPFIAEVNKEKFGSFTPGTNIPIISESDAKEMNPDYFLVLPWHFRDFILKKETKYINSGGKLIFPLPEIEIY